jgi:uncharacterized phage protein gp47/JayE
MPALLDDTGLTIETLQEIKDGIAAQLRSTISETLDVSDEAPLGQVIGVVASAARQCQELAEASYNARDPDTAEGFALVGLAALTGVVPEPATYSYVPCTANLDAGVYAIGSLVAHVAGDATKRFANATEITSAGGNNPGVRFTAESTGPVEVSNATLTVIAEAVAGWNSITNTAGTSGVGGFLGALAETSAALRLRRVEELSRAGSTTVDAIRADLLAVEGVTDAVVIENDTDAVDGDGLPAHSIACVVRGGTAADIAEAIYEGKAAGIATHGGTTQTYTDAQGTDHDVNYSASAEVSLYCTVSLTAVSSDYAGDDAVKAALVAEFGNMASGRDVKVSRAYAAVLGVAGAVDVTAVLLDDVDAPVSFANIVVPFNSYGNLETADIDVTATLIGGYP